MLEVVYIFPPPPPGFPLFFVFVKKSRVSLCVDCLTVNTVVTNVLEDPNVPISNYLSD